MEDLSFLLFPDSPPLVPHNPSPPTPVDPVPSPPPSVPSTPTLSSSSSSSSSAPSSPLIPSPSPPLVSPSPPTFPFHYTRRSRVVPESCDAPPTSGAPPPPPSYCKAPDVVLTLTSRFHVRSELEAHQTPPAHDTRTRVATGFSTTGIRYKTLQLEHRYIDR